MMKQLKDMMFANKINYHLFQLDQPIGEALQLFLKKRNKLM
jgi:hypothetical protein